MFNSPRPAQRYGVSNSLGNGFGNNSFTADDPLAGSAYDGLDPWSSTPSPDLPPPPPPPAVSSSHFSSVIADSNAPPLYHKAFNLVDTLGTGETSVNSLSRVLLTSGVSASTIDRIVNLVSTRPRVSKLEFFVALALVALAQSGRDLSIEHVVSLASQNDLPIPSLDLEAIAPSTSSFAASDRFRKDSTGTRAVSQASYSVDPWQTPRFSDNNGTDTSIINGAPSSISGSGLPRDWWKRQDHVQIRIQGMQGFILNRYMLYEISSDRGASVSRRYSEFVFLWDCLVRRYPFRLLPQLPPKRIGPDESFIEQRRRGLQRFLTFVVNHPVLKEDSVLAVFLTEPSLEQWRKHGIVSYEEEALSKRVDSVEAMTIPKDLEDKLKIVRLKLNVLIEQWQKICILAERIIKRREAAAADLSRLTLTLNALNEVNAQCWRGDNCELCTGVRSGVEQVSNHIARQSDILDQRSRVMTSNTLDALKSQRDLYIAMRDLFLRHDRLSGDNIDRLKKRIETTQVKIEGIRVAQKDNWSQEVEKLSGFVERDQATITTLTHRRVFIRYSMWHELRVVLHNRENTLLTKAVREFAQEESAFANAVAENWHALDDAVENMPYE
ncbi:sorting nexin mvp1 [Pyrrhoderma noxium]|uniref:Sorting nexin MVP1 n=1 Tax=Pyrrhoderma noxium TaxID=2282107 RepID=A0A286UJH2_9AGAM|nr:sorting nexin mvp1 [Pyrrhoderma noxium]